MESERKVLLYGSRKYNGRNTQEGFVKMTEYLWYYQIWDSEGNVWNIESIIDSDIDWETTIQESQP